MSVTVLSARTGRLTSSSAGRTAAAVRRTTAVAPAPTAPPASAPPPAPGPVSVPALTLTLAIPLTGEAMTPQAYRLLDALRELVELGQGTVTTAPAADSGPPTTDPAYAAELFTRPSMNDVDVAGNGSTPADPTEVRLLTASRQVLLGGVPLPTTRLEFDLLNFLAENPRRVFTRMQLLTAVWGYEHTGERTVDVHVRRLRLKAGVNLPLITTVYGVGYRLADEARVVVVANE